MSLDIEVQLPVVSIDVEVTPITSEAVGSANAKTQLYYPHDSLTIYDPNSIIDTVAEAPGGGASRIVMAASGTAYTTPDAGASWRGALRDLNGSAIAVSAGDIIQCAARFVAALPVDISVFAIIYNGSAGTNPPSASTVGAGVVITEDGSGGHAAQAMRNAGAGWVRLGAASLPTQSQGRAGRMECIAGSSAAGNFLTGVLLDASINQIEGTTASSANVQWAGVCDTFAIGIMIEGTGSGLDTIDVVGGADCMTRSGSPLAA